MTTKNVLLVLLFVLGSGCGKPHVDPAFDPYMAEFQKLIDDNHVAVTVAVTVQFGDVGQVSGDSDAGGYCQWSDIVPSITVSKDKWVKLTEYQKRALMFHELGHCVLGRKHTTEMFSAEGFTAPVSYMYPDSNAPANMSVVFGEKYDQELIQYAQRKPF